MDFLEKIIANAIGVILAVCICIGFLWEPAFIVPGLYFGLAILACFVIFIFSFIQTIIDFIGKKIGKQLLDTRLGYLIAFISTTAVVFIIVGAIILIYKF